MMTYYEELGVSASASREEIRQAYKRLVRLLHPDRCGDPATRALAELQMRRLNAILEALCHPAGRAHYDRFLAETRAARRRPAVCRDTSVKPTLPAWHTGRRDAHGWQTTLGPPAAATAGVLVLLLFCALLPSSPPDPKTLAPPAAQARLLPRPGASRKLREPSMPAHAKEERYPSIDVSPRYSPATSDLPSEVHAPESPDPAAVPTHATGSSGSPPGDARHTLAGEWLFARTSETRRSGYPPEYIELRLRENQGVLHGRYRARYHVGDRAISPTVAFQFEGRTAAEGAVLPWHGPAGAQGEISLRLLANGSLEVEWAADQLGGELGLISGTATLVRKLE